MTQPTPLLSAALTEHSLSESDRLTPLAEVFADRLITAPGKLGAVLGGVHPNLPMLSRFIEARSDIRVPAICRRNYPPLTYGMLANDRYGDCVIAAIYHLIMHMRYGLGLPPLDPSAVATLALQMYAAITGFNVNDPATDQGTNPTDAWSFWKNTGMLMPDGSRDQSAGSMQVLPRDGANIRRGIFEFDGIGLSLAMPTAWQGMSSWELEGDPTTDPAWAPGGWGGHEVLGVSYDRHHIAVVTWGGITLLSWQAWAVYGQVGLVQVSKDLIGAKGISETGINLTQLSHDLPLL